MRALTPRQLSTLGAMALVALVFALYLPTLHAPFEYDDKPEILENLVLRHPGEPAEFARYNPFRVLLLYTFAWDLWAWGFRPFGYRLLNIVIHAGNALLVAGFLARLSVRCGAPDRARAVAVVGGLFFAIHPLAIESVTYISGRSASLATTWVLLSLVAWLTLSSRRPDLAAGTSADPRVDRARRVLLTLLLAALLGVGSGAVVGAAWGWSGEDALRRGLAASLLLAVVSTPLALGRSPGAGPAPAAGASTTRLYALAWGTFVAGCLTKEIAAVTPALLLLTEVVTRRSWRAGLAQLKGPLLPFFAIPVFLLLLRAAAYGYLAAPHFVRPWATNLTTQVEVVGQYVRLWVLPLHQSIQHEWPALSPPGRPLTWVSGGGLVLAGAWAVRSVPTQPLAAWGILGTLLALAPESSVLALKETMVEHRTYLPTVSVAAAVASLGASLLGRWRQLAIGVGLAWALALVTLHLRYGALWMGEEVLWRHATEVNPRAASAWRYLGDLYLRAGRWTEAESAFRQTILVKPVYAEAYSKLGVVLLQKGEADEARARFEQALSFAPCLTPAHNNLGALALRAGDVRGASERFERSLRCDERDYRALRGMAEIHDRHLHDPRRAAVYYQRALAVLDPYHPEAASIKRRLLEITF